MATDSSRSGLNDDVGNGTERFRVPDGDWGTTPAVTDRTFGPEVASQHARFDSDEYDNIYIVGDVHGCFDALKRLWERLDPGQDDMVLFVGDLVRKGPASIEVVEFVREQENALSVRGNNEQKLLEGTVDTGPFEPIMGTVASLPLVISWEDALIVHGGVDPTRPLGAHGPEDLLEMRSIPPGSGYEGPFWFQRHDGPEQVFFGHTVLDQPVVRPTAIGLDTGCVYGGSLTAYDYYAEELISIPATEEHEFRPDEKFLEF